VIVKQEDGAGLHTDSTYLKGMKREFDRRDWLLFNQPSQSPVTNVHDACIFPMMSKAVTRRVSAKNIFLQKTKFQVSKLTLSG
jgi:hypothetical protein